MCVSMSRCWIWGTLYVQVCDGGRVRVFVLDRRIAYAGECALARAERYHGIHISMTNPVFGHSRWGGPVSPHETGGGGEG